MLKKKPFKPRKWAYKPRKRKKGKKVAKGISLKKADRLFSQQIRERDKKCLHPKHTGDHKMLQCSHYYGRANKSTRFDPDNCITLCWLCHYKDKIKGFEYQKQIKEKHGHDGQYTLFMQSWLGEERWQALVIRSQARVSQKEAIHSFLETIQKTNTEGIE